MDAKMPGEKLRAFAMLLSNLFLLVQGHRPHQPVRFHRPLRRQEVHLRAGEGRRDLNPQGIRPRDRQPLDVIPVRVSNPHTGRFPVHPDLRRLIAGPEVQLRRLAVKGGLIADDAGKSGL